MLLEWKPRQRAVEIGMLCLGALAARVWSPNSEFVKHFGLLRA